MSILNPNNDPSLPGYDPSQPTTGTNDENGQPANADQVQAKGGAIANPGGGGDIVSTLANIALGVSIVFFVGSILYVLFSKPEA